MFLAGEIQILKYSEGSKLHGGSETISKILGRLGLKGGADKLRGEATLMDAMMRLRT